MNFDFVRHKVKLEYDYDIYEDTNEIHPTRRTQLTDKQRENMQLIRTTFNTFKAKYLSWDWRLIWFLGSTRVNATTIYFNRKAQNFISMHGEMLEQDPKLIKGVLLHELGHAIDVELRGYSKHDKFFKSICNRIGAIPNGNGASSTLKDPKAKWELRCPNHGVIDYRQRRTKGSFICAKCREKIEWVQLR